MEIKTNNYLITRHGGQFKVKMAEVVQDSRLLTDKSKIGSLKWGESHYFSNLEQTYRHIAKHATLNAEDVKTLSDISDKIDELIAEVKLINID